MTNIKSFTYCSKLSKLMYDFIEEKRALGYIYNNEARILKNFDDYWISHGDKEPGFTHEDLEDWMIRRESEGPSYYNRRIDVIRAFSLHLNFCGYISFLPHNHIHVPQALVHILSSNEIRELFLQIDKCKTQSSNPAIQRMDKEYPIIFRLLYCCGLRAGEAINLQIKDVDFENKTITILDGKDHKDRLVYMTEDLCKAVRLYCSYTERHLGKTEWLFPGYDQNKHISIGAVDRKFRLCWESTTSARLGDKRPTPHCLRHTYVVDRINSWLENEETSANIIKLMQYLRKSLGHKTTEETYYYYHIISDSLKIVRQKDEKGTRVIPKANRR